MSISFVNAGLYITWSYGFGPFTFVFVEGVEAAPCVWTLVPHRQLKTGDPRLQVKVEGARITLAAAAYAHGVGHDDRGERLFSDNWFDLVPGLPHTIACLATVPDQLRFAPFDAAGLVGPATGNH